MLLTLLFAFLLAILTVFLHAMGTTLAVAYLVTKKQRQSDHIRGWRVGVRIAGLVGGLLLWHIMEAGIWALFYLISGDLPDLETAFYFSVTCYTTVGYGDVVLPAPWRIVGPLESAVGILMFGWSTAIIVATVTRFHENWVRQHETGESSPA